MWLLLIIELVNGGASPSKFETYYYKTKEQCIEAMVKNETALRYGYCTYENKGR
jgi:hypothetical protein